MKVSGFFNKNKIKEINENEGHLTTSDKQEIAEIEFAPHPVKKRKLRRSDDPHYFGHRGRLKGKIMEADIEKMQNYELLEAMLTYAIPRSDVKPLAKKLLEEFKTFAGLMFASNARLMLINGVGEGSRCFFRIIAEICARMAKEEITNEEISLDNIEKVVSYCRLRMGHLDFEQFRILFLNRKNKLIADEIIQSGTIDKAAIFPRELVKKAIELGAGAMVLVHNHPSGDPTPSKADVEATANIQKAAGLMEVFLYDHIIIGRTSHYSMRANNFQ